MQMGTLSSLSLQSLQLWQSAGVLHGGGGGEGGGEAFPPSSHACTPPPPPPPPRLAWLITNRSIARPIPNFMTLG